MSDPSGDQFGYTHPAMPVPTTMRMQTVAVIDCDHEMLASIETSLGVGRYHLFFFGSDEAYSQIRRLQPDLVVLCTRLVPWAGCQLMTMLHLDAETRGIPLVTVGDHFRPACL